MEHLNNLIISIRNLLLTNVDTSVAINPDEIDKVISLCEQYLPNPLSEEEKEYVKFTIHSQFTIDLANEGTVLGNPDVKRWLDNAKLTLNGLIGKLLEII